MIGLQFSLQGSMAYVVFRICCPNLVLKRVLYFSVCAYLTPQQLHINTFHVQFDQVGRRGIKILLPTTRMTISYGFHSYPGLVVYSLLAALIAIVIVKLISSIFFSSINAPKRVTWGYPFFGTYEFFTARWDLFRHSSLLTSSGNFTFFIGPHQIVGLSGDKGRETFFESRDLSFNEGFV